MMLDILYKLLLVHCIADFLLQWPAMLRDKSRKKFASPLLYVHGLIHFALSAVLVWDVDWLLPLGIMAITHVIIDGLKLSFSTTKNERLLFFIDQAAHLLIIFALWAWMVGVGPAEFQIGEHFWLHALCLFVITFPASITIQKLFQNWTLPTSAQTSLSGIGVYIGYIERILVYVAVVTQQWNLVGFLIAAKSVFRFGDFSKQDERIYAEYLFVGTLLSLFVAILAGLLFLSLSGHSIIS